MSHDKVLQAAVNTVICEARDEDDDRDYSYLHPSEMGDCQRRTFYKATGIKPSVPFSPQQMRVFSNGHFVHTRYQCYLRDAGILARDKIESTEAVNIKLGLTDVDRIAIIGKTGRTYYYEPEEWVWVVGDPPEPLPTLGGFASPYQVKACDLKYGQEVWMVEVPLLNEEYHIGGHADAIIKSDLGAAVVDFKSSNDYSFAYLFHDDSRMGEYAERYINPHFSSCHICGMKISKWKELCDHLVSEHRDHICIDFKHRVQLTVYMWILKLKEGVMLYENKNSQLLICEQVPLDEALVYEIQSEAKDTWDNIINGRLPLRPYKSRKKFPCGWCDWANHCWSNATGG